MDRLRAIETFVQDASLGSFVRAATELRISRPLVSLHIQQLEEHLGVRLINRNTRHLSLTEVGAEYLKVCVSVLQHLEKQEAKISHFYTAQQGALKILASMSFANYLLSPIVAEFSKIFPSLSVTLIVTEKSAFSAHLVENGYDLAIVMDQPDSMSMITTRISEVPWIFCASREYLKRTGLPKNPHDLLHHNCITHRGLSPPATWRFQSGKDILDIRVKGSIFSNSAMVMREAALEGLGIAMLPFYCIEDDLVASRLVAILEDYRGPIRPVFAIYPHAKVPKKVRDFIEFIRERLKANLSASQRRLAEFKAKQNKLPDTRHLHR